VDSNLVKRIRVDVSPSANRSSDCENLAINDSATEAIHCNGGGRWELEALVVLERQRTWPVLVLPVADDAAWCWGWLAWWHWTVCASVINLSREFGSCDTVHWAATERAGPARAVGANHVNLFDLRSTAAAVRARRAWAVGSSKVGHWNVRIFAAAVQRVFASNDWAGANLWDFADLWTVGAHKVNLRRVGANAAAELAAVVAVVAGSVEARHVWVVWAAAVLASALNVRRTAVAANDGERTVNVASLEVNRARGVEVDRLPADYDVAVGRERAGDGKSLAIVDRSLRVAVEVNTTSCWESSGESTVRPRALVVAVFTSAGSVQEGKRGWPVLVALVANQAAYRWCWRCWWNNWNSFDDWESVWNLLCVSHAIFISGGDGDKASCATKGLLWHTCNSHDNVAAIRGTEASKVSGPSAHCSTGSSFPDSIGISWAGLVARVLEHLLWAQADRVNLWSSLIFKPESGG